MSEIEDGGPAFPIPGDVTGAPERTLYGQRGWGGMSLRDFFAAAALTGIVANPDISQAASKIPSVTTSSLREAFARDAYKQADEMLKARAKGGTEK